MTTIAAGVPLGPLTTLGIGGPAARFATITSVSELQDALADARQRREPVLVLGGGSNVVIDDDGFDGLVLHMAIGGIDVAREGEGVRVTVRAGESWDALVLRASVEGWAGIECLAGIPGLVGATPMQNVGAYGQEVGDTIVEVLALDRRTGAVVRFDRASCAFSYRDSVFRGRDHHIVIGVTFVWKRGEVSAPIRYGELARALEITGDDRAPLGVVRETVLALRRGKGMVVDPADPESRSAGSFFVNPILSPEALSRVEARLPGDHEMPRFPAPGGGTKLSAGWLIEHAGFAKGFTRGRVGISRKHALALVNRGGATATELLDFARLLQDGVRARFGVELVREPIVVRARPSPTE